MISYAPLWKTMEERNISSYALINQHGISSNTINRLKHNESITMFTLEILCKILSCSPNDVIEFIDD